MESEGCLDDGEISNFTIPGDLWSCFSCSNPFRVAFLRVYPLLAFVAGVVILAMGFVKNNLKSEGVRMAGVSLVYFSVLWFILGNFVDFCVKIYGKDLHETEEGNIAAAYQTELALTDDISGGN